MNSLISKSYTALLLFSLGTVVAQEIPAAPTEPQPPPANPAPADATPAEERISISLPKATGNDIAQLYRQLTNKRVLVDSSAIGVEANIVIFGDLTSKEEAARSFEKALLLNGFAIIPSGPDEVKIINVNQLNALSSASTEAPQVVTDPANLPGGDNVVTYIMPLRYILPDEAKKTFETLVSKLHSYGRIASVPNASALIITENSSLIRQFVEIKDRIDVPSQQITSKWISVKYADVETLAATIEKIYQPQTGTTNTARNTYNTPQGGGRGGFQQPQPQGNQPGAGQTATNESPPQVIPDARTNRLLLMGRPIDLEFLSALIEGFDTSTDTRNFLRRELKYLTVLDFMPVAQSALQDRNPTDPNAQQQAQMQQQYMRNQQRQSQGNQNQGSTGAVTNLLRDPDETGAPESAIVGKTLLVADTITNSIIVQGPPQSIETISQLLDRMDLQGPQVIISTIFGQFRKTDNKQFGLDWLATLQKDGAFTWGGADFNTGSGWNPSDPASDPGTFSPSLNGLSFYGKFAGNINVLLRAAMSTGKFSVLSRPTIFTKNNIKSYINAGQEVPYPSSVITGGSTGDSLNQNASLAFKSAVLQLEVIPLVNSKDEVTLKIGQQNNQITGYTKYNGMDIPTLSTQTLVTTVTVPNGGTVILGGLITKETTEQTTGIPILSDIPLLGWAFKSTEKKLEEKEIVIFLQPRIIMDGKDGYNTQVSERSRYQVTKELLDFAEPNYAQPVSEEEGLLPNSPGYNQQHQPMAPVPQPATNQSTQKQKSSTPTQAAPAKNSNKNNSINSALRPFGSF